MTQVNPFDYISDLANLLADIERARVIFKSMDVLKDNLPSSEETEDFLYLFTLLEEKIINKLPEAYELSLLVWSDIKQHK